VCGRFAFYSPREVVEARFGAAGPWPALPPRWNIAPTSDVVVLRQAGDGRRTLAAMHWGLVPSWAKARDIGARMINARAETLAEKPSFRRAFRQRRALVLADGYYEWHNDGASRRPYWIHAADGAPFGMAALWETWRDPADGTELLSCAIITREATGELRRLHDRMPAVMTADENAAWLDPACTDATRLGELLAAPGVRLAFHPVSRRVNDPRHDDPELLRAETPDGLSR